MAERKDVKRQTGDNESTPRAQPKSGGVCALVADPRMTTPATNDNERFDSAGVAAHDDSTRAHGSPDPQRGGPHDAAPGARPNDRDAGPEANPRGYQENRSASDPRRAPSETQNAALLHRARSAEDRSAEGADNVPHDNTPRDDR